MRSLQGLVSSNKMDKTVVVTVRRLKEHPIYRKKYTVSSKFKAHDPENTYQIGDLVEIVEITPVSRHKRWRVSGKVKSGGKS